MSSEKFNADYADDEVRVRMNKFIFNGNEIAFSGNFPSSTNCSGSSQVIIAGILEHNQCL